MGLFPRSSLLLGLLFAVLTHSIITVQGDSLLDVDGFTTRSLSQAQETLEADDALIAAADTSARVPDVCKVVTGVTTSVCHGSCDTCEASAAPRNRRPCKCCKAGFFPSKNSPARCEKCPVGTFSAAGATSCRPCPGSRTTTAAGSNSCNGELQRLKFACATDMHGVSIGDSCTLCCNLPEACLHV